MRQPNIRQDAHLRHSPRWCYQHICSNQQGYCYKFPSQAKPRMRYHRNTSIERCDSELRDNIHVHVPSPTAIELNVLVDRPDGVGVTWKVLVAESIITLVFPRRCSPFNSLLRCRTRFASSPRVKSMSYPSLEIPRHGT